MRYNCPDEDCDVACLGWPDLHKHVRAVHHKKICDLCSRHKKVFTHEHELFTDAELGRHMKKGDDNPGAIDQTGFKGHPLCSFCNQRFYGEDELYVHCGTLMRDALSVIGEEVNRSIISIMILSRSISRKTISYV